MRFTRKLIGGSFDVPTAQFYASQKLGKLEDIEEELGIDLSILIKAFKLGAYFMSPYRGEIKYFVRLWLWADLRKKRFDIRKEYFAKSYDYCTGGALFLFKDYGKTWALTKEELEEEK